MAPSVGRQWCAERKGRQWGKGLLTLRTHPNKDDYKNTNNRIRTDDYYLEDSSYTT